MTTITLATEGEKLFFVEKPLVSSGSQNSVCLRVRFDSTWDDYGKAAIFYTDKDPVHTDVVLLGGTCLVPAKTLRESGILYVGIFGTASGNIVKTSAIVSYKIKAGIATGVQIDPVPEIYQQLLAAYGTLETRIDKKLEVERQRIDDLIASWNGTEGSGTADNAELIDIRLAYNGTTYKTAGTAVRKQSEILDAKIKAAQNQTSDSALIVNHENRITKLEAFVEELQNNNNGSDSEGGGTGSDTENDNYEERIKALEEKLGDIESVLDQINGEVI